MLQFRLATSYRRRNWRRVEFCSVVYRPTRKVLLLLPIRYLLSHFTNHQCANKFRPNCRYNKQCVLYTSLHTSFPEIFSLRFSTIKKAKKVWLLQRICDKATAQQARRVVSCAQVNVLSRIVWRWVSVCRLSTTFSPSPITWFSGLSMDSSWRSVKCCTTHENFWLVSSGFISLV